MFLECFERLLHYLFYIRCLYQSGSVVLQGVNMADVWFLDVDWLLL